MEIYIFCLSVSIYGYCWISKLTRERKSHAFSSFHIFLLHRVEICYDTSLVQRLLLRSMLSLHKQLQMDVTRNTNSFLLAEHLGRYHSYRFWQPNHIRDSTLAYSFMDTQSDPIHCYNVTFFRHAGNNVVCKVERPQNNSDLYTMDTSESIEEENLLLLSTGCRKSMSWYYWKRQLL